VPLLCAALVSVLAIHASAQTGKAREQVKQELVEAIRTGDILANSESGLAARGDLIARHRPTSRGRCRTVPLL